MEGSNRRMAKDPAAGAGALEVMDYGNHPSDR